MKDLIYTAIIGIFALWCLATYRPEIVQAAEPVAATPISDNCVEVATVGLLETYFCETPYGDLFINSFGFMVEVD